MENTYDNYNRIEEITTYGYNFKLSDYINAGFQLFSKNPGGFAGYTALVVLLISISSITIVGPILLSPPLMAGFYIMAKKIDKGEFYDFSTFFKGFDMFGQLLVGSIVSAILIGLGSILIVPGVYLAVAMSLYTLFIVFMKMEFWSAITTSIKVVNKNWFNFFLLMIVSGLIAAAGVMLIGIGALVSIPAALCMQYAAYADIVGIGDSLEDNIRSLEQDDLFDDEPRFKY